MPKRRHRLTRREIRDGLLGLGYRAKTIVRRSEHFDDARYLYVPLGALNAFAKVWVGANLISIVPFMGKKHVVELSITKRRTTSLGKVLKVIEGMMSNIEAIIEYEKERKAMYRLRDAFLGAVDEETRRRLVTAEE
jgi:hypothetical protein